jgi:hypothetical protein
VRVLNVINTPPAILYRSMTCAPSFKDMFLKHWRSLSRVPNQALPAADFDVSQASL